MTEKYSRSTNCVPREPAHPVEDDRVSTPAGPGDGSGSTLDALRDTQIQDYSELFDRAGIQIQDLDPTETDCSRDIDFTGPATSFYVFEAPDTNRDPRSWKRKKALHHDTYLDYTGSNRSSTLCQFRDDYAYCQAVIQSLEMPKDSADWVVRRTLRSEVRAFNRHYDGYLGATLAHAVLRLADSPDEFLESHWFDQLSRVVDEQRATFDPEALVRFAFRFQET